MEKEKPIIGIFIVSLKLHVLGQYFLLYNFLYPNNSLNIDFKLKKVLMKLKIKMYFRMKSN